jgi:hypothetical protein
MITFSLRAISEQSSAEDFIQKLHVPHLVVILQVLFNLAHFRKTKIG